MTETVANAFIRQYEADVHIAYQRTGSKLAKTVRKRTNIKGASTTFFKIGKGTATSKSRHGKVPVMNVDHQPVECFLQDFYAGDWCDRLDELKTSIDERQVQINAGAYALGRKTDDLIIEALSQTDTVVGTSTDGLTKAKIMQAYEVLNVNDVPDDGDRYCLIGPKQWTELLDIEEFKNSNFVGGDDLPWQGGLAKKWLGTTFIMHSGLKLTGGIRDCFWYHKSALGHASGSDVVTDISWHGDRAAHFINNMMSQGAALIDAEGVVKMQCQEGA